jgi:hypothetical protein
MIVYHYRVWGRGRFPMAMLSRDRCWPRFEGETAKVAPRSLDLLGVRDVHLQGIQPPTRDLWQSFDWEVSDEVQQARL